ncbi:MAG: hypothetical protein JJU22_03705 [Gammaproteobacteria bacterium]|nr:hypothetical protein [Gammaproteobacteria bacterium]
MTRLPVLLLVPLLLMACAGRDVRPTAEEVDAAIPPGDTERCIAIHRVRSIEPIGNHTLLFHMRGGDVWRNRLRAACPGMHRHSKFLYEVRGSQLCSLDSFYLLHDDGFGFRRGAGCALGEFDLLTEEQAETLRQMR